MFCILYINEVFFLDVGYPNLRVVLTRALKTGVIDLYTYTRTPPVCSFEKIWSLGLSRIYREYLGLVHCPIAVSKLYFKCHLFIALVCSLVCYHCSDHLSIGNIWIPTFLKFGFQIVWYSNGWFMSMSYVLTHTHWTYRHKKRINRHCPVL